MWLRVTESRTSGLARQFLLAPSSRLPATPPLSQGKANVPKGDLKEEYKKGVLFVTYSLLVTRYGAEVAFGAQV